MNGWPITADELRALARRLAAAAELYEAGADGDVRVDENMMVHARKTDRAEITTRATVNRVDALVVDTSYEQGTVLRVSVVDGALRIETQNEQSEVPDGTMIIDPIQVCCAIDNGATSVPCRTERT